MSAGGSSKQDFELNLASIIDCFTVLITYLLVSASFIALGAFQVTVAAVEQNNELPQSITHYVNVSVMLQKDQTIGVQVESDDPQKNITMNIPTKNGEKDLEALSEELVQMKERYQLSSLLIGAEDSVAYKELVKVVSKVQKLTLNIALSAEGI